MSRGGSPIDRIFDVGRHSDDDQVVGVRIGRTNQPADGVARPARSAAPWRR